jgi:putative flippase GtrA
VRSLVRYALVSGTCLVAHNAIMVVCDALGRSMYFGAAVSFVCVVFLGYALHSRFTFTSSPTWPSFVRYVLAMAANLPLSIALLWVSFRGFGLAMWLAAPLATGGMVVANFILSRWAMTPRARMLLEKEHAW